MKEETIHDRMKQSRLDAGLSQGDVARALGISREAVGQWEKAPPGKKPTKPKGEHLIKFGELVNRNPKWLETGKGTKEYIESSKELDQAFAPTYGWICPICGRVNAPTVQSCPNPHEKN